MPNPQINIRLSPALYEKLLAHTESLAATKSEIVSVALVQYLHQYFPLNEETPLPVRITQLEKRLDCLEQQQRSPQEKPSPSQLLPTLNALPPLHRLTFEVINVDRSGKRGKEAIAQVSAFKEWLNPDTSLEMIYLPGGSFVMGASREEKGALPQELPGHEVQISPFALGQLTITQAQWRIVAQFPKINRELNLDPSHFKGDNHPVEQIAWYDALEFCDRLSRHSGRQYRLPSEAEWEYACRAQTTTPFHFGETLTGDLANYVATRVYREESPSAYQQSSCPVGSYPPNAFGLFDMHGNIWEWCADHWHPSYENAPTQGVAWLSANSNEFRVLRGGSWDFYPEQCRSAYRYYYNPNFSQINQFGLRVACDLIKSA
jgi:formylglycine-generating enzyme required for sulfatase activity